ncbi:FAD/NAD(P)-binding domain-containing protein [Cutaneotrichosporon oleaginosum]|uniref:FAD/NAD(P)-binding domain-containing protein n=1 Tax=Cutaneotrichosporon oleaginosum TaxID=879819 RepID=A0A0J0XGF3_9TREE|nr:FAD/NAD(P)-binding domain-containing protein [Cutaneotrichosporon oleaginosum]KLT40141.1 FAD/NAD(P)-binding domain-containing protein [Cutaneotrichosporon oleaginosum]TXT06893.1 hypothetical protein COLE_06224 [Cutaneotrichosporon oleaginosum]
MTSKDFTVAIVGGGIAGLTLAIALHARNVNVTVYERAAAFGEIGAGVSFTPNAVEAMKVCHMGVYDAFERVCTRVTSPEKRAAGVFFDYVKGYDPSLGPGEMPKIEFTLRSAYGQNAVHRAHFLDELVKLLPADIARFGKGLVSVSQDGEEAEMRFEDGSTARADVVIGCDGIKSRVRRSMFGDDAPCAYPSYTHKYAYRGLIPIEKARAALGDDLGGNAFMHLGPNGHLLTFPVAHGKTLNVVAFHQDDGEWPDAERLTRQGTRAQALKDFEGWSPAVQALLSMCDETLSVWAIFDLANPVPSFSRGRVALSGDAAHATSPHHGAGAGFCIEDAAVLATLLSDPAATRANLPVVLEAYDAARRERGHWLVESSRHLGRMYDWQESMGNDMAAIHADLEERYKIIYGDGAEAMCEAARDELHKRIA